MGSILFCSRRREEFVRWSCNQRVLELERAPLALALDVEAAKKVESVPEETTVLHLNQEARRLNKFHLSHNRARQHSNNKISNVDDAQQIRQLTPHEIPFYSVGVVSLL